MPRPFRRSKIQIERDRVVIGDLYLKGWNQLKIAEYLELDQPTVSRELKKIRELWKAEIVNDYSLHITEQLHRLSQIEAETWQAWERSQTAKELSLLEKMAEVENGGDSKTKVQRRTETRIGDVKFLETLIKCHQERSRLLGLCPSASPNKPQDSVGVTDFVKIYLPHNHRDGEFESAELSPN